MPFVESRGRRIYYERRGEGPPVLFCHGAGSNAATWWQQLPAFAKRHSCITVDLRCFGRSVAPLDEFSYRNFVADTLAVLDREEVARITCVGQSLGGFIGLRLALAHPERMAALVACDSSLGISHPVLVDAIARRQVTHAAVSIEQRSLGRWFLENCPEKALLYEQINRFNASALTIPEQAWNRALSALLDPSMLVPPATLREVACPTLLLVGRDDPIVPVAAMTEVQALIPRSELAVVEEAGHSAYFEKPLEFNAAVLDFISRRAEY